MRDLKWYAGALLVAGFCFTAHAATNPDPFNVKRAPIIASPAPVQPVAPVVATAPQAAVPVPVPAPWTMSDILQLIWTVLGAGGVGAWIKQAFFPKAPAAPGEAAPLPIVTTATGLLNSVKDPAQRKALDEHLLSLAKAAVDSGIPGAAIQSGASLIPGVGPLAAQLEPMLRKIVSDALATRVAPSAP